MINHRDRDPKTLEEWDNFLFRKYSHGLYAFCYVVANIICESDCRYLAAPKDLPLILKNGYAAKYKQIRHRLSRHRNLLERMIQDYAKDLKLYEPLKKGKIIERNVEYIKRLYPEVERLKKDIKSDEEVLRGKSLWKGKGHPTDTKNKIAFVFAQVIKKENGEPDWKLIRSLLMCLWKHIKKATYSSELSGPVYITTETLKNAYSKFTKNSERKSDIESLATLYFSPRRAELETRIEFKKSYITLQTIVNGDIESRYPTIVFPDGTVLKGMFNLEEAAAFLDVPPLFLERLCEKELVPYKSSSLYSSSPYQDDDDKERIFSRTELMEWKKKMFGNGPILKRKLAESGKEESCNKEDI